MRLLVRVGALVKVEAFGQRVVLARAWSSDWAFVTLPGTRWHPVANREGSVAGRSLRGANCKRWLGEADPRAPKPTSTSHRVKDDLCRGANGGKAMGKCTRGDAWMPCEI